jgi:outer membrane protein OmpA-like peptidoglycan-associated protein
MTLNRAFFASMVVYLLKLEYLVINWNDCNGSALIFRAGFMKMFAGFKKLLVGSVCLTATVLSYEASAQTLANFDNNVVVDLTALDEYGSNRGPVATTSLPYGQPKLPPVKMPKSTFHGLPNNAPNVQVIQGGPQMPPVGQMPKSRLVMQKPVAPVLAKPSKPVIKAPQVELVKPKAPVLPVAKKQEVAKTEPRKIETAVAPKIEVKDIANTTAPELPNVKASPVKPVEVAKVEEIQKPKEVVEEKVQEVVAPVSAPKPIEVPKPVEKAEEPKVTETAPAPAAVMAAAPPPPPTSIVEPKEVETRLEEEVKEQAPTQTAALPPATDDQVRVTFDAGTSKMPGSAQTDLNAIAEQLAANQNDRVQLLAYAGGEDVSASKARRLSLSRALAVRSYLISKGVRSTRIDVRALGNKTTEQPFDRVDVKVNPR